MTCGRNARISLGQPGVGETEESLLHAQDGAGPRHLRQPDPGQAGPDLRPVHGLVKDVTALASGARARPTAAAARRRRQSARPRWSAARRSFRYVKASPVSSDHERLADAWTG